MNQRILITGATGFLGSEVVRQFQAGGAILRTTGRARSASLPDYRSCDLEGGDGLAGLVEGVKTVVHVAALAHQFKAGGDDRDRFFSVNTASTKALAEAAGSAGVEHFVFISSMAVYGAGTAANATEDASCRPVGPYAESKHQAENILRDMAARTRTRLTILRPATIYGEGDPGNVARLMRSIDRRRFFWIGSGSNRKTLIHVEDAARAIVLAAARSGGLVEVFNVAAPPVRMRDIVDALARELGRRVPPLGIPGALVRIPLRLAAAAGPIAPRAGRWLGTVDKWLGDDVIDGGKLSRVLDFAPAIDLAEGIRREVRWYRDTARS